MQGLIGKKLGMTQIFNDKDDLIPVTVIEAGPCFITQIKTNEKDGYKAIQVGFGDIKEKHLVSPARGHFAKAGVDPTKHLTEFIVEDPENYQLGQTLTVETFAVGEKTDVVGWSKGKGFAGVIKRWNFSGGPGGHGSHFHRSPGSIGMAATPSRVIKGKKMPGHYGDARNTILNLEVVKVDADQNIILVKGAVPGPKGSLVLIKKTNRSEKQ